MSPPGPFDPSGGEDPFGDWSRMLDDLMRSLGGAAQGPGWAGAAQLAASVANRGSPEPNVDPTHRIRLEELGRIAELHIVQTTGLVVGSHHRGVTVEPSTRSAWTAMTVEDYRPLFERLSESIGAILRSQLDDIEDEDLTAMTDAFGAPAEFDPSSMIAGLRAMLGPMMTTAMAGTTVGQLGSRAFGSYDLPIPRPPSSRLQVVEANVSTFASEWTLPLDELWLWICLHEVAHHAVLGIDHVRGRLISLLADHAASFSADPSRLDEQLGDLDLDDAAGMARLQSLMADPDVVFGAMRSDRQLELQPFLDAIVVTVEGYVDWVLDTIGTRLIGSYRMITEAMRRRRVTADQATRFVERLFGLELTQAKLDLGGSFIAGVIERAGSDALADLWDDPDHLPTPAEIEAPGLWLARVGRAEDQSLPAADVDVPDFPDLDS